MDEEFDSQIFGHCSVFREIHTEMSHAVSNETKVMLRKLDYGNDLALSMLRSVLARSHKTTVASITTSQIKRAAVQTDFVRNIVCFENALFGGYYGAAATLLRKEIEAVNVCYAFRQGSQRDKKVSGNKPFKHLSEIYKTLSGIAHNTDQALMDHLAGGVPYSPDPVFNPELAKFLLGQHVFCIVIMSLELAINAPYSNSRTRSRDEKRAFDEVMSILLEQEVVSHTPPQTP